MKERERKRERERELEGEYEQWGRLYKLLLHFVYTLTVLYYDNTPFSR